MAGLLAQFEREPRVRAFLERALAAEHTAQSYLFLGAPGSGKLDAAWALAQALLCEHRADAPQSSLTPPASSAGGCGTCDSCIRVARHTHPDVHYLEPESASGYLISQVRELLDTLALAPIRGQAKVYIIDRAEKMRANTANALLKTLEEPPPAVSFILLGTHADAILPTIVSRCQCVPFHTRADVQVEHMVERASGMPLERARLALSCTATPTEAIAFLKSPARQEARRLMLRTLDSLAASDGVDVLRAAKDILQVCDSPFSDLASAQKAMLKQNSDYLSRGALKELEERNKRELTAQKRSAIMEVLASARSLMRDVLCRFTAPTEAIVNTDVSDMVEHLYTHMSVQATMAALDAIARAEGALAGNVSPQLAIEVMLFDIRKAYICRR